MVAIVVAIKDAAEMNPTIRNLANNHQQESSFVLIVGMKMLLRQSSAKNAGHPYDQRP